MKDSEVKKILLVNLLFWLLAILVHPVIRLFPSASGSMPKFYEVLVPLFMLGLAYCSTVLLKLAIRTATKQGEQ